MADDTPPHLPDALPIGRCSILGDATHIREHLLLYVGFTLDGGHDVQPSLTCSTAQRCDVEVLHADLLKFLLHVLSTKRTEAPVLLLPCPLCALGYEGACSWLIIVLLGGIKVIPETDSFDFGGEGNIKYKNSKRQNVAISVRT